MNLFRNHLGFFNSLCSHNITSSRFFCCTGLPDLPRQRERPGVEQGGKGEIVGYFFHGGGSNCLSFVLGIPDVKNESSQYGIIGTEIKFSAHILRYSTPGK